MANNMEIYEKLKGRVTLFSVQIPEMFERSKTVKVGGVFKGSNIFADKLIPEKLVEVTLEDCTSDFSVVTLAQEFNDGIAKQEIKVGDIVLCDGIMTDLIDGQKIIVITSVEKA